MNPLRKISYLKTPMDLNTWFYAIERVASCRHGGKGRWWRMRKKQKRKEGKVTDGRALSIFKLPSFKPNPPKPLSSRHSLHLPPLFFFFFSQILPSRVGAHPPPPPPFSIAAAETTFFFFFLLLFFLFASYLLRCQCIQDWGPLLGDSGGAARHYTQWFDTGQNNAFNAAFQGNFPSICVANLFVHPPQWSDSRNDAINSLAGELTNARRKPLAVVRSRWKCSPHSTKIGEWFSISTRMSEFFMTSRPLFSVNNNTDSCCNDETQTHNGNGEDNTNFEANLLASRAHSVCL